MNLDSEPGNPDMWIGYRIRCVISRYC